MSITFTRLQCDMRNNDKISSTWVTRYIVCCCCIYATDCSYLMGVLVIVVRVCLCFNSSKNVCMVVYKCFICISTLTTYPCQTHHIECSDKICLIHVHFFASIFYKNRMSVSLCVCLCMHKRMAISNPIIEILIIVCKIFCVLHATACA